MPQVLDLLDEVMAQVQERRFPSDRLSRVIQAHACDGCGQVTLDVDLWAENSETGEILKLCQVCGDW